MRNTARTSRTSSADDSSILPSSSPSSQSGAVTPIMMDEMMRKMMEMMNQREQKYEEERVEREKLVSEEKAMLLKLLNETKQREGEQKKENEFIIEQLRELRNNKKQSSAATSPVVTPAALSSSLPALNLLSPENEQKLKKLAFTIRSIDFKKKNREESTPNRVNIDDYVEKQESRFFDPVEEKVKNSESKYEDKIIYEDESDDESCLQSYIKWLEKREQMYPYDKHKHQLYKKRYTLLSAWGRYSEWLRTGFYLGFPISLYGITINRWYLYQMQQAGLKTTDKTVRKVSDHSVMMPAMSQDNRDTRVHAASEEMDDILPNSLVLRNLPVPLRYAPDEVKRVN